MELFYLGIDLGGTRIKIGIVQAGKVKATTVLNAAAENGLAGTLQQLVPQLHHFIGHSGFSMSKLGGIGLAFPGLVNPYSRKIISTNKKYDDAPQLDLIAWAATHFNVPFYIENDARMAAVGEWKFGAGRGCNDLVAITIGTGIGTAAIIEGRLLRGKHFQAGCLGGHLTIDYKGRTCTCGNAGCLEAHAATWSLKELALAHPDFQKSSLYQAAKIDFETLFAAAKTGDLLALELKQHCIESWAAGIVNLIHAYDPERVIVGGGVSRSAPLFLNDVAARVNRHAWCPWGKVELLPSTLIEEAALLGLAYGMASGIE